MILAPTVLSIEQSPGRAVIELHIPGDLVHFAGHFPGLPILPGVVQIDWAIRQIQDLFGIAGERFNGLKGLKFSAPIPPAARVTMTLADDPAKGRVQFTIESAGRTCTSGQMLYSSAEPQ